MEIHHVVPLLLLFVLVGGAAEARTELVCDPLQLTVYLTIFCALDIPSTKSCCDSINTIINLGDTVPCLSQY
jgi:hypothetical protein